MKYLYYLVAFLSGDIFGFFTFWKVSRLSSGKVVYFIPSTHNDSNYSLINKLPLLWYIFDRGEYKDKEKRERLKRFAGELSFGILALLTFHLYGLTSKAIVIFAFLILFTIINRVMVGYAFVYYPLVILYSIFLIYYSFTGNVGITVSIVSFLIFLSGCYRLIQIDLRRMLIGISLLLLVSGYYSAVIFIFINALFIIFRANEKVFNIFNYISGIILLLIGSIISENISGLIST